MLFTILLIVCPNKAKNERAFAMAFLMTEKDDENFGSSTECWIFHNMKMIPIVFRSLKNYDLHHIM